MAGRLSGRGDKGLHATSSKEDYPRSESDLHAKIFDECRRRGWIALHGSMSERTHRTPGEFDFVILADCGRIFLVECKTAKGKLSLEQLAMKIHAEHLGHKPAVIRSMGEFMELIANSR